MSKTWTQEPPKETGFYWMRKSGLPDGDVEMVTIDEFKVNPEYRPPAWGMTAAERKDTHIKSLKVYGTPDDAIEIIRNIRIEFYEIWWFGPVSPPPFPGPIPQMSSDQPAASLPSDS